MGLDKTKEKCFTSEFLEEQTIKRHKIIDTTTEEINALLDTSHTRQKLLDYITGELEQIIELQNDWKTPETLKFCEQNLDYLLKTILNTPKLKELFLKNKKWSRTYTIRESIVNIWSNFLDKNILDIILKNALDMETVVKIISWELENIYKLREEWSSKEILDFYYTNFSFTLKKLIENKETKDGILYGSRGTKIYRLRREIAKTCSDFLDPDIVKLLNSTIKSRNTSGEKPNNDAYWITSWEEEWFDYFEEDKYLEEEEF